jgi:hypothetical protein
VARRALGDNGHAQRCIKTVHGLGYRFVAAVATRPDAEPRPLALASPLAPSPLHTPSAAQLPARTAASEGVWEHKPVAVLAIELTWPGPTAPEALGDAPWRVTAAWQHTMVEQVQAFSAGSSCSARRRCCWWPLERPKRWSSCRSGRCRRPWRSDSGSWRPPTVGPVLRCA